jgi:sugar phosphate isomerase/epimerase
MRGADWTGSVDEMLDAVAAAGYAGIEITNTMIREYAGRPAGFAKAVEARGLRLAAFAYASSAGFTDPGARQAERAGARKALDFVAHFPGVPLCIGGAHSPERSDVDEKIALAADFYNEAGRLGRERGVDVAFHPHSHHGSILESRTEYDRIMELTDPAVVKWNPDTGHIVRGGQDLLDTIRRYGSRIRHVHLKDADRANRWQPLGKGICDIPGMLTVLETELSYSGWLVCEEESAEAWADPAGAIRWNRGYLASLGH